MKIQEVWAKNFGSYETVKLDFVGKKLTLIAGNTGSGKSTLCDLLPWALHGKTAKGGGVNDVRSWGSSEPTNAVVNLQVRDVDVRVVRSRGASNDLYFTTNGSIVRGKDMLDTQALLNRALGADEDLFLASAYFHEFSQVAAFFTSNAKVRRTIIEQLVDMSFPIALQEKIASAKKDSKDNRLYDEKSVEVLANELARAKDVFHAHRKKYDDWEEKQGFDLATLQFKADNFTLVKEQQISDAIRHYEEFDEKQRSDIKKYAESIKYLKSEMVPVEFLEEQIQTNAALRAQCETAVCEHCGSFTAQKDLMLLMEADAMWRKSIENQKTLQVQLKSAEEALTKAKETPNHYALLVETKKAMKNEFFDDMERVKSHCNPYEEILALSEKEIIRRSEAFSNASKTLQESKTFVADLDLLQSLVSNLRRDMIVESIAMLETYTNQLLEAHFDAEIRVQLSVESADKVEVNIHKNENVSTYSQLSKGQRQILKLCFGVSVMRLASEKHGIDINVAFFDEALDGLSEEFKLRAYGLLKSLESRYESIFCVEHSSELKAHFENKIQVSLIDGKSVLEEA